MRKGICFISMGQIILMLFMMNTASPVYAMTERAVVTSVNLTSRAPVPGRWHRPWRWRRDPYTRQENNQFVRLRVNNANNKTYRGHDQGNSGNHGRNSGYNEDNSSNAGNQVVNRKYVRGYLRNNQHYQLDANNSGNIQYFGHNQGNSGNSGCNRGFNRDNSSNFGNQILN